MIKKNVFKRLFKVLGIVVLMFCAVVTSLDVYTKIQLSNPENWKMQPIYSVVVTDEDWQLQGAKLLEFEVLETSVYEPVELVPLHFRLEREEYVIEAEVNPKRHFWHANMQLRAKLKRTGEVLRMESAWLGNCGRADKVVANEVDVLSTEKKLKIASWGQSFFNAFDVVGFLWYPDVEFCDKTVIQTPQYASKFPIMLEIYYDDNLIGSEEVPIRIFENGILRYQPITFYFWEVIFSKLTRF